MNFTQLKKQVESSERKAILTLKKPVFEDCYFSDKGMKAVILHFVDKTHEDNVAMYEMFFDVEAFRKHNKAREVANYYDKQGEPCLTATEAGMYEPKDFLYVMGDDNVEEYFDLEWVEPEDAGEKKTMVCSKCGSKEVRRNADTAWSEKNQCWEIVSLFDSCTCEVCEEEVSVEEKLLTHEHEG
jgi:hypothetical protein